MNFLLLGLIILSLGCAQSALNPLSNIDQLDSISGTWTLTKAACNDKTIDVGDMSDAFTVSGNMMSTKNVSVASDCEVNNSNITLTMKDAGVVSSGGTGASCTRVNCVPNIQNNFCKVDSCQIPLTINGMKISYSCPQNFSVFLDGIITYAKISTNTLVRTVSLPDKTCQYSYKQ